MTTTNNWASRSYWPAKGFAGLFAYATGSHRRAVAVLVLVSLLAFLPGFFQIPPVDRDEAYFAQATKQMIETSDYVDIRYQDDVRYRKPVGIYWLQAAVVKTASALALANALTTIWLYRVPSLFGAVGAVLATYWCALAFVSRRGAILSALMMAASTMLGVEARLAKTDAVLLLTVVVAMSVLARVYLAPRRGEARPGLGLLTVFWTALAAGILIKGPLILMVVGLAAAALAVVDRSARWLLALRPLPGIAWLFLLVLPWFIAIYARVGSQFLVASVGEDMLAKVASSQETHGAPPGLYIVLFFATFFPASILAGLAAPAVWAVRREPAARFLLAWLVPSWIVFELVVTKLPHYVLPLYPAIAILIAGAVEFEGAVAPGVARSRRHVVVPGAGDLKLGRGDRRGGDRSRSGAPGLAVLRRGHRVRTFCLAIVRRRRRRAFIHARHGGLGPDRDRHLRGDRAVARAGISQCRAGASVARFRLPAPDRRQHGVPGTEPGFSRRHHDPLHRHRRRGRFPARRDLSVRLHRRAGGARIRTARRGDRLALRSRTAHRRLQHQRRQADHHRGVRIGRRAVNARNALKNLERWSRALVPAPPAKMLRPPLPAVAATVAMLIAVVVSMFVLDTAASDWAAHQLPQWFRNIFEEITNFGLSGWFLIPFGFVLLCLAAVISPALSRASQGVLAALAARFGFLFLAIGVPGLFVTVVKRLIGRARPYAGGHDDPFAYMPLIWRPEFASMPSGHATTAVSAAIAIGAIWPRTRAVMWLYAFVIMFSRVVVLAHYPSDVIAGALTGAAGVYLVRRWFAARRLVFGARDLRSFPGPSWQRVKAALGEAFAKTHPIDRKREAL